MSGADHSNYGGSDPSAEGVDVVAPATPVPVSATPGDDYTPTKGTLTFEPGETSKTVSVPVIDDSIEDSGETVQLHLSNATRSVIDRRHGGRGLILNDELSDSGLAEDEFDG